MAIYINQIINAIMITTNVVLLEFLIRSRNLSDTGIAITSSTLVTTFLALSLMVMLITP